MFARIRGTRDLLNLEIFREVVDTARKHVALYRYKEIQTPILESRDLFCRSLGEGTDVVKKEMFLVRSHHDEESEQICLRPEATASIMRAYLSHRPPVDPWRVFTYGSMFRHERPQKGRYREFTQLNLELIGGASEVHDAEIIHMWDEFFLKIFNNRDYKIQINFLGSNADRDSYKKILHEYINSHGNIPVKIGELAQTNLLRVFDLKDEECQKFMAHAPEITDYLSTESHDSWQSLRSLLESLDVSYVHNPYLVRGLDYYNNMVFEFSSKLLGAQSAFCSGGRYDGLAQLLGARDAVPAVGAALGIDRVALILEEMNRVGEQSKQEKFFAACVTSKDYAPTMLNVISQLRIANIPTEFYADKTSLKSAFKKADNDGALAMLIVGDTERDTDSISIKNMKTGEQVVIPVADVISYCTKLFED